MIMSAKASMITDTSICEDLGIGGKSSKANTYGMSSMFETVFYV